MLDNNKRMLIILVVLMVYLTIGLYAVKNYAATQATKVAVSQLNLQVYNSNKAACGIRTLVNLPKQERDLATYENAAKDPTLNAAAKKRNATRVVSAKEGIKSGKQVIELFGTIPPDFDCTKLPKKPPKVKT